MFAVKVGDVVDIVTCRGEHMLVRFVPGSGIISAVQPFKFILQRVEPHQGQLATEDHRNQFCHVHVPPDENRRIRRLLEALMRQVSFGQRQSMSLGE